MKKSEFKNKYPTRLNGKIVKEYNAWRDMFRRCFDDKIKEKYPTYKDVICCEEWLEYENFYEWLHSQENFDKWLNGYRWAVDKDILIKGNKVYSSNTCCLIPMSINNLFSKGSTNKNKLPIGVNIHGVNFQAYCGNLHNKKIYLGTYKTPEEAFYMGYKPYKESLIKQVAQIEFDNGNITKKCYEAMLNHVVEIDD